MLNKTFFVSTLLLIVLSFVACNEQKDGLWEDNIHLSQKSARFDAQANAITITTRTATWWVDEISFDNTQVQISQSDKLAKNFEINTPVFSVLRKEGNQIQIKFTKNETGKERVLRIALQNGNYFDGVVVSQGY